MVERQMKSPRLVTTITIALCWIAALGPEQVFASDAFATDGSSGGPVPPPPNAAFVSHAAAPVDAPSTDEAASGNPLWGIPLESLHATRERPLFSPSRRPPAVIVAPPTQATVAAAPAAPEPVLNLLGTVAGNGEEYAVFINTTTHDIVRLKRGESEGGWILRSVGKRKAVLKKDDRTEVLQLPPIIDAQSK
jgi:hypothetical protein